jgi:hypothetical protein
LSAGSSCRNIALVTRERAGGAVVNVGVRRRVVVVVVVVVVVNGGRVSLLCDLYPLPSNRKEENDGGRHRNIEDGEGHSG